MEQTSSIQLPSEYPGKPWQPLFDHLAETQDKILTLDEMEELVSVVAKMIGHRELLEKADRYEKALKEISNLTIVIGSPRGNEVYKIAREALTHKTSEDEKENNTK